MVKPPPVVRRSLARLVEGDSNSTSQEQICVAVAGRRGRAASAQTPKRADEWKDGLTNRLTDGRWIDRGAKNMGLL